MSTYRVALLALAFTDMAVVRAPCREALVVGELVEQVDENRVILG